MENPSKFLEFAIKVAKKSGDIQMSYFGKISSLDKKSTNIDLVTNADIQSEEFIIEKIKWGYNIICDFQMGVWYYLRLLKLHMPCSLASVVSVTIDIYKAFDKAGMNMYIMLHYPWYEPCQMPWRILPFLKKYLKLKRSA